MDAEIEAEGERKQKPVRYIFFDCETQQDRRVELGGELVQRHDVNLICSEVLCEACLLEGITTTDGAERMAKDCVFGISAKSPKRFRYQHLRSRRLQFNNFEDPEVGICSGHYIYTTVIIHPPFLYRQMSLMIFSTIFSRQAP